MPFKSEIDNPLRNLVELSVQVVHDDKDSQSIQILTCLRIHPDELNDSEVGAVRISFREATLSCLFHGIDVIFESKLGNRERPTRAETISAIESQTTENSGETSRKEASGAGRLSGSGGELSLAGKAEKQENQSSSHSVKKTVINKEEFYRVMAVGNDNWRISEPGDVELDGVYLNNERLCAATTVEGANRRAVELELIVRQRDLKSEFLKPPGYFRRSTKEKAALQRILMAKNLTLVGGDAYSGYVVFARAKSHDEG